MLLAGPGKDGGDGPDGGAAWTTTLAGLHATMSDGSQFRPPWTI